MHYCTRNVLFKSKLECKDIEQFVYNVLNANKKSKVSCAKYFFWSYEKNVDNFEN